MVTTLVRGSGTASAAGAEASENVVAAVLTASVGSGAKEYVVGVSTRPNVLSFSDVFSSSWVAAVTAESTAREKSANNRVCALLLLFEAFRSAELPLTESFVSASSCPGSACLLRVSSSLEAGGASSPLVASLTPASPASPAVVLPAPSFPVAPAAERDVDFLSGESTSVPADEAARFRAELLRDQDSFFDEDLSVCENLFIDGESPVGDVPDESAYAVPGAVAMATPTPRVTARAPTRPMCLA